MNISIAQYQTLYDDPNNPLMGSSNCKFKPLQLVGAVVYIMRAVFSDPDNIDEPLLSQYRWGLDSEEKPALNEDKKPTAKTSILIESAASLKPINADTNPGIIVKRGDIQRGVDLLGNRTHGSIQRGDNQFIYLSGTVIIDCISNSPLEAELLSWFTGGYLTAFGNLILNHCGLLRFKWVGMSDLQQYGAKTDPGSSWKVSLTFGYDFDQTWEITTDGMPLRQINVSLNSQ